jgi:hypothetical protein
MWVLEASELRVMCKRTGHCRSKPIIAPETGAPRVKVGRSTTFDREIGNWPLPSLSVLWASEVSVPLVRLPYSRFEVDPRTPTERGQFGDVEKLAWGAVRL